jgi:hypothetical protein
MKNVREDGITEQDGTQLCWGQINFLKYQTEDLRAIFGTNRSELIRSIIRNEKDKGRPAEERTLRELWYDAVKIPLMRLEPDKREKYGEGKWGRKASQALSAVLSDMVLAGELRYRDIGIRDASRLHTNGEKPFDEVIVFVEDNATFQKVKSVAKAYRITMIEGKGFEATALIEKLQRIDPFWRDKRYRLVAMTDYDAYGHKILEDLISRMQQLGFRLSHNTVEEVRIGIMPEDIDEDLLMEKRFEIPVENDYDQDWVDQYGIDGAYGLELQAAEGPKRREILIQALEAICPEKTLYDHLREESWGWIPDEGADELVERVMGTVKRQVADKIEQLQESGRLEDDRADLPDGTVQKKAENFGYFIQDTGDLPVQAVDLVMDCLREIEWDGSELYIDWKTGEDPDEDGEDEEDE